MNVPLAILLATFAPAATLTGTPRPNIILAMADDMGWGDPGSISTTVTFADGTPHPDQGWIRTVTRGPGPEDITIEWPSVPGAVYRLEASHNLGGPWNFVANIPGTAN